MQPVVAAYRSRIRDYGATPPGVVWRSEDRQTDRFMVLLDMIPESDRLRDLSLNDLGCGYGALLEYARRDTDLRIARYQGYDACPEMIQAAGQTLGDDEGIHLEVASEATREADYSVVSGTFNLKIYAREKDWEAYVKQSLMALWKKSRRGMAFNLLSKPFGHTDGTLYLADPGNYLEFCLRHMSGNVVLRHDYMPDDFTIWVMRTL
ncbi:class I SAM-dependent methyltransferase [Magnetospira sp. QH-2]|uniref:class I SAM-dependent methyltransferase n=1 Tax=Magnetospira sp. (strain QH-2) TaxID=1288970 RepID=UPI0003E80EF7|nr:class I SAM-dependent methyltransferase [Magnetospira sp. QH-2]CCQ73902.1 Conserved protein of unknown function [Magnetospira sp. QH-2]